jgi:hypothetical protein
VTAVSRIALAREALALRGCVLELLAGAELSGAAEAAFATGSPRAWRLLVTAESCALPLMARLREGGLLDSLPLDVSGVLAECELAEMQRVMAARSQLRDLDGIAARLGLHAVVLKGGALVVESDRVAVDLGDLDLLVDRDAAALLWERLLSEGWRKKTVSGISATDDDAGFNHFEPLLPPRDGLPVELHSRARYGSGHRESPAMDTRPLRGLRALSRTVGPAAFVSMLEHSVIKHPHRRGHLRDLVLLGDALRECDPADRPGIAQRLAGSEYEPELRAMLALVEAMERGAAPVDAPSIRSAVARKYLLVQGDDGPMATRIPGWWALSYFPLERPSVRRARYRELARSAFTPIPAGSPFAAKHRVARAGAVVVRSAYRCALVLVTVGLGGRIRRRSDLVT